MTVSAAGSSDLSGRPLRYRWVLLQGDPGKVRITPHDEGLSAELEIGWHDRFPVQSGSAIHGNRVDVGLFVGNGKAWSAPAFVSVLCPDNELRTWDEKGRLIEIDYAAGDCSIGYETPTLLPADGIAPYDIRDWPALLREAAGGSGLFGRMCANVLPASERDAFAALAVKVAEIGSAPLPGPAKGDVHRRWQAERKRSENGSRLLLDPTPGLAIPAKQRIEGLLNAWIQDPGWLSQHERELSTMISALPEATRQRLAWTAPTATRGGLSDLAHHHLAILTNVLLPGIIVREPNTNLADPRLGRPPPVRLTLGYNGDSLQPSHITEVRNGAVP